MTTMLDVGSRVERYRVESVLGKGGMAMVFRVIHETMGSEHALKILLVPSDSKSAPSASIRATALGARTVTSKNDPSDWFRAAR